MRLEKVESSVISSVAYDNNTLIIKFVSGGIYAYSGVPFNIYDNFLKAESKGKYFLSDIKDRYNYIRLD